MVSSSSSSEVPLKLVWKAAAMPFFKFTTSVLSLEGCWTITTFPSSVWTKQNHPESSLSSGLIGGSWNRVSSGFSSVMSSSVLSSISSSLCQPDGARGNHLSFLTGAAVHIAVAYLLSAKRSPCTLTSFTVMQKRVALCVP